MRYALLFSLIVLSGCCGGGNPNCIGFPAPWTWFNDRPADADPDYHPTSYQDAVDHLPKGTCNDTNEDWPGVPKCPVKP
jgi:hypothetical protein